MMPRARAVPAPAPVLALVVLAWTLALAAAATGTARQLHHHELIGTGESHHHVHLGSVVAAPPLWVALLLFLVAWQVHIAAMMLPSSLPLVSLFDRVSTDQPRPASARAAFLAGYAAVWTAFGALAFAGDVAVHRAADRLPWLAARPWLVAGTVLALAGLFQFSALKDRCLRECRHPGGFIVRHYRRGSKAAFALGARHGLFCVGCCWALMLVMLAVGVANLVWMAPLALLMFYEKSAPVGRRLTAPAGVALLALATLVVIHPAWLPPALVGV